VFPLNVPPFALRVTLFVAPLVTVAPKLCCPGPIAGLAGETAEMVKLVGVTVHVVDSVFPPVPVTVGV